MTERSGKDGAIYYNEELEDTANIKDIIVYSTANETITSSTGAGGTSGLVIDFAKEGYTTGMLFTLSNCGSTKNERIYTINTISCGTLTVAETITTGGTDTGTPTFSEAEPGRQVAGFYNWTLTHGCDALDVTSFDNSTSSYTKTYIVGLVNWSASAEKYWIIGSTGEAESWLATTVKVRFFEKYVPAPTTGNPAIYWTGDSIVTGVDTTVPVDTLVTQSLSFQGDGAITLATKSTSWSSTG